MITYLKIVYLSFGYKIKDFINLHLLLINYAIS